jgi:hypothetical protein
MTVLDCRLNNTPFKLDNVQKIRHQYIDGGFDKEGNKIAGYRKQIKLGFHSIGAEK